VVVSFSSCRRLAACSRPVAARSAASLLSAYGPSGFGSVASSARVSGVALGPFTAELLACTNRATRASRCSLRQVVRSQVVDLVHPGRVVDTDRRPHDPRQVEHHVGTLKRAAGAVRIEQVAFHQLVARPGRQVEQCLVRATLQVVEDAYFGVGMRLGELPDQLVSDVAATAGDDQDGHEGFVAAGRVVQAALGLGVARPPAETG